MGDSTLVEFLRDLSIIIVGSALVVWLLVMAVIAILVYKKLNAALASVKQSARNIQESSQAVKDSLAGKNPVFRIAAAGVGKAIGLLFRAATKR